MKKTILDNGIAVLEGDSHLGEWVKQYGTLDHDPMIAHLARYIAPGTVAIDAGASIGDHTAGYLKSDAFMVAAFEPNPVAYECLVHNCPKAMCFNCGLGPHVRTAEYMLTAPNFGASFIDRYALSGTGAFRVLVCPLDMFRFPKPVSFIKADIEGFELEFLRGAQETIKRDKPFLCLEINNGCLERNGTSPEEVLKHLSDLGYRTQPVFPSGPFNELQWDCLAIPT